MDIIDESVSINQNKYSGSFEECLTVSQDFVSDCATRIQSCFKRCPSFFIRTQDDKSPFHDSKGNLQRFCDIEFRFGGNVYFVECKDFCRCWAYPATGLPIPYVEKIRNSCGEDIIFLFRDNMEFVEKYASKKHMLQKEVIEMLVRNRKAKELNGKIEFVPYGQKLNILMEHRNFIAEEKVHSAWTGRYYLEKQYMWNLRCMDTIENLIRKIECNQMMEKMRNSNGY